MQMRYDSKVEFSMMATMASFKYVCLLYVIVMVLGASR